MSTVLNRSISEDSMMSGTSVSPSKTAVKKSSAGSRTSAASRHRMDRMSTLDTSDSALSSAESDEDISFNLKLTEHVVVEENPDELGEDATDSNLSVPSAITSGPRRISIVDPKLKANMIIKEGNLLKQMKTFGRWIKRYCTIENHKLFLRKSEDDKLREEVLLKDATVVENSAQNVNHAFIIMTPHHKVTLAAFNRKELEEWMSAVKQAALDLNYVESLQHLDGQHSWFNCSHPRPTYCNVCGDALNGVAWHGFSCEVCKFKSHRRCVFSVSQKCKWSTRADIEITQSNTASQNLSIPHQWMEGNLPAGSKCMICNKSSGSTKRLQDFRCLWCKQTVHTDCKNLIKEDVCSLGSYSSCVLPPSAVKHSNEIINGMWEPYKLSSSSNPVLAFVNSKSGDNRGVRFLRRLKYWLNPLQVFDLAISGPEPGLQLFQRLDQFRVLVFGGDGSVGWVLSTIDKLHLHSKCIFGVVPLGTGNDLARVLGWGSQCHDEDKLPVLLGEIENSRVQLLDRWSVGYTKDSNFNVSALLRKGHSRSHSSSSIDNRMMLSGSPSPQQSTHLSVATPDSLQSSISPEPPSFSGRLSVPLSQQDSVSINSSSSYVTPLSRSPSSSLSEKESLEDGGDINKSIDRTSSDASNDRSKCGEKESSNEIEVVDGNHVVMVTPPQDSSTESLKWVGSLQDSIASHLSTILLSDNEDQVLVSSQVLCEVVKQFLNSLQTHQLNKLSSNRFGEDPLVMKCSVLNDKLESLTKTLKEELLNVSTANNNTESDKKKLKVFQPRQTVIARANSLKKAIESILDTTEKALDDAQAKVEEKETKDNEYTDNSGSMSVTISTNSDGNLPIPDRSLTTKSPALLSIDSAMEMPSIPNDFYELACMNNYFGLGLDAKITYEFHTRREENPLQFKNRARNMLMYGYLGGREFFTNTQKHLERKLTLECDGKNIQLPQKLQGLVFLNIPSYMAGTNFWGTEKEKDGFLAPSMDDKLIEVAGVTGFTHLATTKVLGIQNQRLAQCRYAKVTVLAEMPMQVDGEARMQQPGTITITHKNKARVIARDKTFSQSLETWSVNKRTNSPCGQIDNSGTSHVTTLLQAALTVEEISSYQDIAVAVRSLMECISLESECNIDVMRDLTPHVTRVKTCLDRVFPSPCVVSETADLEHLQDMETSVKSLIQETLWFLNMDKILPERESEMRNLVVSLELKVKNVILAQHSTRTIAHRGHRTTSDSILVLHRSPKKARPAVHSNSQHRDRSIQAVETKVISNSNVAISCIGKDIKQWDSEDISYWLKAVDLEEHTELFLSKKVTGQKLVDMKSTDFQDLGIDQPDHLRRIIQCLRTFKQPKVGQTPEND